MKKNKILYGGAFNPPTIAHLAIIKYLLEHYPKYMLVILPTNDFYKDASIVPFEMREKMVELMCGEFLDRISISRYEEGHKKYEGTRYTLKHFHHPYFVIGADSVEKMSTWIDYQELVKENEFIVFPRDNIDCDKIIASDPILNKNSSHFHIIKDFKEVNASSSDYRKTGESSIVPPEVQNYILANNLYKEQKDVL